MAKCTQLSGKTTERQGIQDLGRLGPERTARIPPCWGPARKRNCLPAKGDALWLQRPGSPSERPPCRPEGTPKANALVVQQWVSVQPCGTFKTYLRVWVGHNLLSPEWTQVIWHLKPSWLYRQPRYMPTAEGQTCIRPTVKTEGTSPQAASGGKVATVLHRVMNKSYWKNQEGSFKGMCFPPLEAPRFNNICNTGGLYSFVPFPRLSRTKSQPLQGCGDSRPPLPSPKSCPHHPELRAVTGPLMAPFCRTRQHLLPRHPPPQANAKRARP